MTGQAHDVVLLEHRDFKLCTVRGTGLFEMEKVAFRPPPASTACWRGYCVTYAIEESDFLVDSIVTSCPGTPPAVMGVQAEKLDGPHPCGNLVYRPRQQVEFTGRFLIGHDLIRTLYVHGGFQDAWKFNEVLEVKVQSGQVLQITDRTLEISRVRDLMVNRVPEKHSAEQKKLLQWYQTLEPSDGEGLILL
ncbi:hypothetical protein [Deinococcus cellulosilyticus]|uniref:Uncharacterized protein n=1 Tax=Deinococcus cellulosilyticus (strain DSM 18568 / NBRC 106333 / KACC 11606 / 5516J-15) TaxID=1223518 RepID=A0A511MYW8_DEIC1|nr:hypothetical protein [Deinococcus cellulosilyticus]GEM45769.1 hypothetical protein DC3_14040 [Deinococcus cellulosilyticus NBRC 106333 = KACC 11606]